MYCAGPGLTLERRAEESRVWYGRREPKEKAGPERGRALCEAGEELRSALVVAAAEEEEGDGRAGAVVEAEAEV